ncbi:hypothetical protein EV426DRAFT_664356 [Tirmania nivea]|nr:hypothetical protein EV426DRAFT_664356 [Tirmania nivea]
MVMLDDLRQAIDKIPRVQVKRQYLRLIRIQPFLDSTEGFSRGFLNVTNILAFVWGPIKFILRVVHAKPMVLYSNTSKHTPAPAPSPTPTPPLPTTPTPTLASPSTPIPPLTLASIPTSIPTLVTAPTPTLAPVMEKAVELFSEFDGIDSKEGNFERTHVLPSQYPGSFPTAQRRTSLFLATLVIPPVPVIETRTY